MLEVADEWVTRLEVNVIDNDGDNAPSVPDDTFIVTRGTGPRVTHEDGTPLTEYAVREQVHNLAELDMIPNELVATLAGKPLRVGDRIGEARLVGFDDRVAIFEVHSSAKSQRIGEPPLETTTKLQVEIARGRVLASIGSGEVLDYPGDVVARRRFTNSFVWEYSR